MSSSSACLPARPRHPPGDPLAAACVRPFHFPRGGERSSQIQSCSFARTFRSFGWVRFWFLEKVGSFPRLGAAEMASFFVCPFYWLQICFFYEKGKYIKHKQEHSTSSQLRTGHQRKRKLQMSPSSSSSPDSNSPPSPPNRAKSTSPPGKGLQALELLHAPSPGTPSELFPLNENRPPPCRKGRGTKDPPSPNGGPATGIEVHRRREAQQQEQTAHPLG